MNNPSVTKPTPYLPTQRPPTHILKVEVPLCLTEVLEPEQQQAVDDCMKLALSVSRAAYLHRISGQATVEIISIEGETT